MPIQYPGNSISKEARAKAGGGFESAVEVVPPVAGSLLFVENFDDYAINPSAGSTQLDASPNYDTLRAKGINCSDSIRFTARSISEISGPDASEQLITESVTPVTNPSVGSGSTDTALRVRYAQVPLGGTTNSEFEWQLVEGEFFEAGQGTTEIWMQHDLYIPENFKLRDVTEGTDLEGFNPNNKMGTLYAGGYSGIHPTMIMGGGPSYQDYGMPYENTLYATQQMKKSVDGSFLVWNGRNLGSLVPYVYGDFDLGHWLRITYRLKLETSAGANDGIHEAWIQRHVGEADTYVDKLFEEFAVNTHFDTNYPFLDGGVILGYSNIGWDESTNFFVDNLIISDTQSGVDQTAITVSQPPAPQNRKTYLRGIGSGDVVDIRRPGGMVDGDTVVIVIWGGSANAISDPAFIGGDGAGFSNIYSSNAWNSSLRQTTCGVFVKKVTDVGSEPLWYQADFAGKTGQFQLLCMSLGGRGDSVNNCIVQETISSPGSGQASPVSIDLAGLTAREGDDLIWIAANVPESFLGAGSVAQSALTFPSGFTPVHKRLATQESFGVAVKNNVAAGATGTISGSFTYSDAPDSIHHGVVIAVPKESA